jgi:hypothetical protein
MSNKHYSVNCRFKLGMWEYIFLDLDFLTILLISSLYPKMISTPLLGFSLMQSGINILFNLNQSFTQKMWAIEMFC